MKGFVVLIDRALLRTFSPAQFVATRVSLSGRLLFTYSYYHTVCKSVKKFQAKSQVAWSEVKIQSIVSIICKISLCQDYFNFHPYNGYFMMNPEFKRGDHTSQEKGVRLGWWNFVSIEDKENFWFPLANFVNQQQIGRQRQCEGRRWYKQYWKP